MEAPDFRPVRSDGRPDVGPPIFVRYQKAVRNVSPVGLWYGETRQTTVMGWLLHCYDWDLESWCDLLLSDCNFSFETPDHTKGHVT